MSTKQIQADLKNKIIQGTLMKRSKFLKQWRQRFVVLTQKYISTFTDSSCRQLTQYMDLSTLKSYKSYINNNQEMHPAAFKIRSGQNAFYFTAKSTEQKWAWVVALQRMMDLRYRGQTQTNNMKFVRTKGLPSVQSWMKKIQDQSQKQKKSIKGIQQQQNMMITWQDELNKQQKLLNKQKASLKAKQQGLQKQNKQMKQLINQLKQKAQKFQSMEKQLKQLKNEKLFLNQSDIDQLGKKQDSQTISVKSSFSQGNSVQKMKSFFEQIIENGNKDPYNQKNIKPQSHIFNVNLQKSRNEVIKGIFDQFLPQLENQITFRIFIDFLIKISLTMNTNYNQLIIRQINSHVNRRMIAQSFVYYIQKFKDYQNCQFVVHFCKMLEFECPHLLKKSQNKIIHDKLFEILRKINYKSLKVSTTILKAMIKIQQTTKYQRSQGYNKIMNDIKSNSFIQENKKLAKQLLT